ncbi:tryptophan 2,3-dioxygenase family protein [Sinomicrobium kalidii]|uniref:tryptophan 2,3-dioxygenase family protein n=1 Tax=Sinomicrobium kalidii TaxID=2900738 RepID=UPI001E38DB95|nr:tryptophan 2,3-dioxygenase family protein [Sinomicrobium kalidii]UGU17738.1 tryptophan 2,3-dioxygenase family protein [Sinomicrobium kalidii]
MDIKPEIAERIYQLEDKYRNSGQDLGDYLDGLLHQRYLTYWDYIQLDTLLSLQIPRTHFPDEEIFIMYHQITELYFKLIIHEQKQIIDDKLQNAAFFIQKIERINRYFKALITSFEVMINGMEREQFLQFRMSLLPASGFQSAQYRMIELYATPMENLVHHSVRDQFTADTPRDKLYENIYWKKGATDTTTGEKTLTLKQFEYRYTPRFMRIARQVKDSTIYHKYLQLPDEERKNPNLIRAMKALDTNANVNWPLMHLGSAYRYLRKDNSTTIDASGGTNWRDYLPPSFQKVIFFPEIWDEDQKTNWGKEWVEHMFNPENTKN